MPDCVYARITRSVKAALWTISISNGYHYNIAAVEQARRYLQINGRWDFILLLENEPGLSEDQLYIEELDYSVWFFPAYNDELVGIAVQDLNSEIAYHTRNAHADIARCLTQDITRGGLAAKTEVTPMGNHVYAEEGIVLYGSLSQAIVTTKIDNRDHYNIK